jgi:3-oxoacyl-[acyl-carrier-protein] synthase-3
MSFFRFDNIRIRGISAFVPEREINLLDDPELYGGDQKRIDRVVQSSGFLKRRITDSSTTASDLCFAAARDLLAGLAFDKTNIDALVFVSSTPDYLMPATAYVLHGRLGLGQDCIAMDVPQACPGYEFGIFQASMLIQSGCKNVLVLVGDTWSKFTDMFRDHTAPVFGDSGTATLVSYDATAGTSYMNFHSDGTKFDVLLCNHGAFRNPVHRDDFYGDGGYKYEAHMNGGEVFSFAIEKIAPSIEDLLVMAGQDKSGVDYFVLHQANKYILSNIALQLNVSPDKIPASVISKYGNQCAASVPCVIADSLAKEVTVKEYRVVLSGFGAGLGWANVLTDLKLDYCSEIKTYNRSDANE